MNAPVSPGGAAEPILTIDGLRISFALQGPGGAGLRNAVVRGVSFAVRPGRTLALVGESGSGKSVISQAIMGILPRTAAIDGGRILFRDPATPGAAPVAIETLPRDGEDIRALRGGRIGMIFQEPMSSLSPVHTIGDQIEESLRLHRPDLVPRARAETEKMLDLVGFRDPHASYDRYPFELSGGLRQRAMLAMAMICRPALLIADEPTTALDVTIQAQVLKLMKDLQAEFGMAILLITHDLGVVANMADDVVVIYHGEIMESGPAAELFRRPQHPYLKALLAATPHFDMAEGERLVSLREAAPGAALTLAPRPREAPVPGRPLLSARGLDKSYGQVAGGLFRMTEVKGFKAVDDVSFDIARGECLGLVGESGCGKTTVSKILLRAVTADSGSVLFGDGPTQVDVLKLQGEALQAFRPRMQMIFQDPVSSLSPRMTVMNILREPLDIHGMGDVAARRARVADLMRAVGLDPRFLSRYPHSFSGGQRQRIGIARALALNPDLIVCDEAVSALDVSVQAQILNLLKDLQRDLGLTYLFISHNLAVVGYMAERIAVMARGRIVETAPRHILFRNPAHPYTQALLRAVPFADVDRKLDFEVASVAGASDQAGWAPQFRDEGDRAALAEIDLGHGHRVLARRTADYAEVRP